jgi:integrase
MAERQFRRRAKLTDTVVAALRPNERVYDTEVKGFFVERGPAKDSKPAFRILKDMPAKLRKWNTPKTLFRTIDAEHSRSAKFARVEAKKLMALIHSGVDPKAGAETPGGWTLAEAWDEYHNDHLAKRDYSPATRRAYEFSYKRLPAKWHKRPMANIVGDTLGLRRLHKDITTASGENSADASLALLGVVHNHARGIFPNLPEWPARAVTPHGPRTRSKDGLKVEELPVWWQGVQQMRDPVKREMMLFMLLSGLRYNDVRVALAEHLDESERKLFIPAPKGHRPGNERRDKAFWLPVTDAIMACIERARAAWAAAGYSASSVLFPSARSKSGMHGTTSSAQWTGDDGHQHHPKRGHLLRHTFVNVSNTAGVPHAVRETLLNHTLGGPKYGDSSIAPLAYRVEMENISAVVMKAIGA